MTSRWLNVGRRQARLVQPHRFVRGTGHQRPGTDEDAPVALGGVRRAPAKKTTKTPSFTEPGSRAGNAR